MPLQAKDSGAFAQMLSAVAAVYGREVTPDVTAIYWAALAPYDLAAVRQAFDRHVKSPDAGQFMPKPADLIRMLGGTSSDAALQAWAKVERAIRRVGGHDSVAFDDPLIHRAIDDMGGWVKLCATTEDELPFRARDFQNLYRGFAMRREIPTYPPHLIGRFEAQNRQSGQPVAPPVLIGEPAACRLVLKGGTDNQLRITRAAEALALSAG
jgi:hypothetical protein